MSSPADPSWRILRRLVLASGATLALAACSVGPRYRTPPAPVPPAYKENANWKQAQPSDQVLRGKWWEIFQDPQLNELEEQIDVSNQTLKQAEERFFQAREQIPYNRAAQYPSATVGTSLSRNRQSQNRPPHGATPPLYYSDLLMPVDVSYEADVWGRVRHTVQFARASAQVSAADLQSVRLSLQAELAVDYFQLRSSDAEKQLLDSTVNAFEQALQFTRNRYQGGVASAVDVAQAQTQLETTRAQDMDLDVQRSQLEHAIATLIGQPASTFSLPRAPWTLPPPLVPVGLPSQLLERRPDIAASERSMAAANEQLGLSRIAYYPLLTLSAIGGFEGSSFENWFNLPSLFGSMAAQGVVTALDVGRRRAANQQQQSAYRETADAYRQTVLTAFQEVEDNLAALRILEDEAQTQQQAVASAERSLDLSNNRYRGGVATYLEVLTAQSIALSDERASVDILRRRMTDTVLLIKALGGGWDVSSLPSLQGSGK